MHFTYNPATVYADAMLTKIRRVCVTVAGLFRMSKVSFEHVFSFYSTCFL